MYYLCRKNTRKQTRTRTFSVRLLAFVMISIEDLSSVRRRQLHGMCETIPGKYDMSVDTYPAFSDATIDIWGSLASCKGEGPERGTSGAMFCSVFAVMPAT